MEYKITNSTGSKVVKKPKKDEKSIKRKIMDTLIILFPGGKKIKKATKERTGSKTMEEKHIPK